MTTPPEDDPGHAPVLVATRAVRGVRTTRHLATAAPRTIDPLPVPLSRVLPRHAGGTLAVGDHHPAAALAALVDREPGHDGPLDALLEVT